MIVVRVELWPGGDPAKRRLLTAGTIACLAEQDDGSRGYRVELLKDAQFLQGQDPYELLEARCVGPHHVWRSGEVHGHRPGPRGAWDLLGAACVALLRDRLRGYRREAQEIR